MAAVDGAPDERPRLLALRALGVGDLLTAVPALRALAASFPGHRLELAAPAALAPLVGLVGGGWAVMDTGPLAPVDAGLPAPDVAVNLHGCGPESHCVLLEARPHHLVAFENSDVPESQGGPEWRAGEHEVPRWCRMLDESGVPADPEALDIEPPEDDPTPAWRGATLVHPGAASGARRWPAERFAAVARSELAAGRPVAVTGSAAERGLASRVVELAGLSSTVNLAGTTDLSGLAAAVAAADRVVCGDTGVAHLATALGTPSVVLFGPTSPEEWGPPASRPIHRALWRGRCGDPHAAAPEPGLLEIGVDEVVGALGELPGRRG